MKKFKSKKGFTLVECVVAMAVLAIMSLLLMMILNVTIKTRNNNMYMERELDQQVDQLVKAPATAEAQTQKIEFVQDLGGVTTVIDAIPGDGSDGMKAKKIYNDGYDAELDALDYDYDNYQKFKDIAKGVVVGSPAPAGSDLVYGAADVESGTSGYITITEITPCADNGNGTKTVTMKVSTNVLSASKLLAIKVTLPSTASKITLVSETNAGNNDSGIYSPGTMAVSDNVVRIEPNGAGYVESTFTFVVESDDYDNNYVCAKNFYTGSGSGNSAQFQKDGAGKFTPVP
ncbi:MAG: prepilin-type N-terminal cleavage/methylation domain-containing protein [Ruminococcaceae bacterium]|nr:prepilin-type N-terminal cleavage/methylation domain-containing protein [Oscillospiraceae bacterium]